ncbi:MAG: DUF3888 domain-containing protein [Lachnospiraceae bacterium]|nr:DUF3888 domain-containing protein [Lachnospiraceae bacterium]
MNKAVPIFLIAASVIVLISAELNPKQKTVFNVNAVTKEEICQELIIALFFEDITGHVQAYYKANCPSAAGACNSFTPDACSPTLYLYETEILSIHKKNGLIAIQFGVTPQTGAHNPAGYDKLTYVIDSAGKGRLTDYKHVSEKP